MRAHFLALTAGDLDLFQAWHERTSTEMLGCDTDASREMFFRLVHPVSPGLPAHGPVHGHVRQDGNRAQFGVPVSAPIVPTGHRSWASGSTSQSITCHRLTPQVGKP